jgi:hypothetical protein
MSATSTRRKASSAESDGSDLTKMAFNHIIENATLSMVMNQRVSSQPASRKSRAGGNWAKHGVREEPDDVIAATAVEHAGPGLGNWGEYRRAIQVIVG